MNLLETYDSLLKGLAQSVCAGEHLRARPPALVRSAGLPASASDFQGYLRRGTSVRRLERRLPPRHRHTWDPHRLLIFDRLPVLLASPSAPVIAALDDTLCKKTGRHIPGVGIARDPMSPAFHVNLCYGLRFVQLSLLVSPIEVPGAARALLVVQTSRRPR